MSNGLVTTILPTSGVLVTKLIFPYLPEISLPVVPPTVDGPGPIVYTRGVTYDAALSGTSMSIAQSTHNVPNITGLLALDPNGYEFGLLTRINTDNSVSIESNVDLTGYRLIISGV